MKKPRVFPVLLLIFPLFFACQMQIPTAVEIRGTPEFRFSANMNIGGIFAEKLEQGFESADFEIIPCVNTINFTYIIHNDLFNEVLDMDELPDGSQFGDVEIGFPLNEPKNLVNTGESIELPFSGLGEYLYGFSFINNKAVLFVSGSDIINKLSIGITLNDGEEQTYKINGNKESGRAGWGDEYILTAAPFGGYEISIPLDGTDVSVGYRVFAEAGETFSTNDFNDAFIKVELVIWLPLEFKADADGAEIEFPPGSLFGENDLFGRDSADAENIAGEIIESLSLDIRLNTNPFFGKDLIAYSGENIRIKNKLDGDSLKLIFNEENIEKINDPANWPFVPGLSIVFDQGDTLKLPRVFNTTELVFTARGSLKIDLDDLLSGAGVF